MNSLLLIIELPKGLNENVSSEKADALMQLSRKLSPIAKRCGNIEAILPNIWRIPSSNGLSFLRTALDQAGDQKFPCRVLALDEEPNWIQGIPSASA